ncbi:MAG: hypothetical protein COB35_07385 [Gammaproteobacteria bacterium]|nr:MAG: hypothetical protein COB35_07385 [Gammaproteobacteria bacterium]
MTKNIHKYLNNYAEIEVQALLNFPQCKKYQQVVIIPAFKESNLFVERFCHSVLASQNVLFIIVINQPDNYSDSGLQQSLWQQCLHVGVLSWQNKNMTLVDIDESNSSLLLVDRFSTPIAVKQGVGLARKIGADIALALMSVQNITSRWLYSSDADAHLPDDYFSSLSSLENNVVVAYFNFDHFSSDIKIHQANQLYQTSLRYYVAGLEYAGSAYAFYTIGSILAFDGNAYAMARGFPKRSAGEDFYLINKLAKLGEVKFIRDTYIKIDARTSDRVPFGTGPAVNNILALQANNQAYCYYDPQVFELLKETLIDFKTLWQNREQLPQWLAQRKNIVQLSLLAIGLTNFVNKQSGEKQSQFEKQLTVWFDAFKTLKFIHALREHGIKNIDFATALKQEKFQIK